jgi:hypothetical protein
MPHNRPAVSAADLAAELGVRTADVIEAAEDLAFEAARQGKGHMSVFRSVVYSDDVDLAPDAADAIRAQHAAQPN